MALSEKITAVSVQLAGLTGRLDILFALPLQMATLEGRLRKVEVDQASSQATTTKGSATWQVAVHGFLTIAALVVSILAYLSHLHTN